MLKKLVKEICSDVRWKNNVVLFFIHHVKYRVSFSV